MRVGGWALGAVAVLAGLAACGEPEFTYPRDSEEGVYFRIPRQWTVFDQTEEFFEDRVAGGSTAQPMRVWVFDSADDPDVDHANRLDLATPVGTAQIIALSTGLSNNVSVASVRSVGFDFDPVNPQTGLEDTWEVVVDQSLRTDDGISGAIAWFNYRDDSDDDWLSQARQVFVDPSRQRAYILDIYCTATCFEQHQDEIFDILNSWRIEL